MANCSSCGGQSILADQENYILVCLDCGNVLEDSDVTVSMGTVLNINSETAFKEIEHTAYYESVNKVFKYFRFSEEATKEALRFYIEHKSKISRKRSLETALVLAALIGSDTRSGWLISDYIKAYPEDVDINSISAIHLTLTPLFGAFEKPDNIDLQIAFVIRKIYAPLTTQLRRKSPKSFKNMSERILIDTTQKLLRLIKQYGLTEGTKIRPFICAAALISSQYLQGKSKNDKRGQSFKKFWEMNAIGKPLDIGRKAIRIRYNGILEFLDVCISKLFWLPDSGFRCAIYFLKEIIDVFSSNDTYQCIPGYQVPNVKKAEEQRKDILEALKEAKEKFDKKQTPQSMTSLEFHAWNLLCKGYTLQEIEGWHVKLIFTISQASLFKEQLGTTTVPPDINSHHITVLDMADREVGLYLK